MVWNCMHALATAIPQPGVALIPRRGVSLETYRHCESAVRSAAQGGKLDVIRMEVEQLDFDTPGQWQLFGRSTTNIHCPTAPFVPPPPPRQLGCGPSTPSHCAGLHAALLATPTSSSLVEQPSRLTTDRLRARPALVPAAPDSPQALGLGLPAPALTVQRIAEALGYDYKVIRTISGVLMLIACALSKHRLQRVFISNGTWAEASPLGTQHLRETWQRAMLQCTSLCSSGTRTTA